MLRWIAMALNAPTHRKSLGLIHLFHRVNPTVARNTTHPPRHVGFVVEIHVVRQAMNSHPGDRLARTPTFMHRPQLLAGWMNGRKSWRTIGADRAVAIDASRRRRNSRMGAFFHINVAVAAIHFQFARMNLVAKGNGLVRLVAGIQRDVASSPQKQGACIASTSKRKNSQQRQEFVGPSWKEKSIHSRAMLPKRLVVLSQIGLNEP